MKVTKVNRYNCEHCNKRGYSAGHMRKHEQRCTANPDRKCGMHYKEHLFDGGRGGWEGYDVKERVAEAMALLPDPKAYEKIDETYGWAEYDGLAEALVPIMEHVSAAVGNCPACILAALRQKGMPYMLDVFNFKEAVKKWRDEADAEFGHNWR